MSKSSKKINTIKEFKFLHLNRVFYKIDKKLLFSNLNLKIRRSEKVFISGPSGSGKTTLINIICGISKLYKGSYKINKYKGLKI